MYVCSPAKGCNKMAGSRQNKNSETRLFLKMKNKTK
jgi:hypothetical protein